MSIKQTANNVTPIGVVAHRPRSPLLPRELSERELALFISVSERREVSPGEVIFRRGELGRSMFIVESGQIRLEFGDGMPDKLIGPREFFGELTLFIGDHTRVANAVATTSTVMHVIEQQTYDRLLDTEPRVLAQFMRRSFAYLVASEQQLIASLKRRNEDLLVTLDSLRQTQTQLSTAQRLVQTDELTGLCNRRGLYTFLEQLANARLDGTELGLLLIDIDRFKQINDRCGHLIGDQVLRAIAEEVQSAASPCDLPCRLGGDEFALLTQVTGAEELASRAEQIISAVRALRFPACTGLQISVSIGAQLCEEAADWAIWYSETDCLLYEVKGRGGDGYRTQD
ncbi:MAG: GGDEF domain-containing protein [Dokdonella sp.]|uniref:GGDEF domain-containing protein n=1 Tax=Dokdonella sp. TaxID=2291710 RepID=UPI002CAC1EB8|nr:GGDEF domain-containing protein [Xanthomonadales bacterium]HQV71887.1 GGDEF domain-containing protein [Dokdonella sp.]MBK7210311.1 GGDEF domain-containing protein [Xanthomonadales bacterium]MBL0223763.1 GGDEF domain-containing protein [Xanthomonadales bacterium]HQW77083.1 GGDEF domain-containing protein [Dokdonella sp.]